MKLKKISKLSRLDKYLLLGTFSSKYRPVPSDESDIEITKKQKERKRL